MATLFGLQLIIQARSDMDESEFTMVLQISPQGDSDITTGIHAGSWLSQDESIICLMHAWINYQDVFACLLFVGMIKGKKEIIIEFFYMLCSWFNITFPKVHGDIHCLQCYFDGKVDSSNLKVWMNTLNWISSLPYKGIENEWWGISADTISDPI